MYKQEQFDPCEAIFVTLVIRVLEEALGPISINASLVFKTQIIPTVF